MSILATQGQSDFALKMKCVTYGQTLALERLVGCAKYRRYKNLLAQKKSLTGMSYGMFDTV